MKRIKIDHSQDGVLEALGLTHEDANAITADETHPDCFKMRAIAAFLNGTADSNWMLAMILANPGMKIAHKTSEKIELMFDKYTEEDFIRLDAAVEMFNNELELDADEIKETIEGALMEISEELVKERRDD